MERVREFHVNHPFPTTGVKGGVEVSAEARTCVSTDQGIEGDGRARLCNKFIPVEYSGQSDEARCSFHLYRSDSGKFSGLRKCAQLVSSPGPPLDSESAEEKRQPR